jgi:hypothetical protein
MRGQYAWAMRNAKLAKLDIDQLVEMLEALSEHHSSPRADEVEPVNVLEVEQAHVAVCALRGRTPEYVAETVNMWFENGTEYTVLSRAPMPCTSHPNRQHWALSATEPPSTIRLVRAMEEKITQAIVYDGPYRHLPFGPKAISQAQVRIEQRRRMCCAVSEGLRKMPYQMLTVKVIVTLAGVSRRAFYENFRDRSDIFLHTYVLACAVHRRREELQP